MSTNARRNAPGSRTSGTLRTGRERIAANPFVAVAGAAAVSAGLALLLPSSKREAAVMGDVAAKLSDVARDAAETAVELGRTQVETLAQNALATAGEAVVKAVVSSEAVTATRPAPG